MAQNLGTVRGFGFLPLFEGSSIIAVYRNKSTLRINTPLSSHVYGMWEIIYALCPPPPPSSGFTCLSLLSVVQGGAGTNGDFFVRILYYDFASFS